jgi:Yip1 domain
MAASSVLSLFVDIVVSPRQAFTTLRERPHAWLPLLLLAGLWIVLWSWYFKSVDYAWLTDHMIAVETSSAPADKREAITQGITRLKPGALIIISSAVVIALMLLISVVISAYLVIVSAILDHDIRFHHWFSLMLWASIPSVFTILAMVLNVMLTPGGRVPPEALNPLSLGSLIGLPPGHRYSALLGSVDLITLWTWGLLALGIHLWTHSSWTRSLAIVLIPAISIYGTWALLA